MCFQKPEAIFAKFSSIESNHCQYFPTAILKLHEVYTTGLENSCSNSWYFHSYVTEIVLFYFLKVWDGDDNVAIYFQLFCQGWLPYLASRSLSKTRWRYLLWPKSPIHFAITKHSTFWLRYYTLPMYLVKSLSSSFLPSTICRNAGILQGNIDWLF